MTGRPSHRVLLGGVFVDPTVNVQSGQGATGQVPALMPPFALQVQLQDRLQDIMQADPVLFAEAPEIAQAQGPAQFLIFLFYEGLQCHVPFGNLDGPVGGFFSHAFPRLNHPAVVPVPVSMNRIITPRAVRITAGRDPFESDAGGTCWMTWPPPVNKMVNPIRRVAGFVTLPMSQRLLQRKLCVAPMMERTDRHFRFLVRLISRRVHLYTEMVPAQVLLRGDRERRLQFHPDEHPLALQVGGDDPALLSRCARWARDFGYDEINLNIGCPSERVRAGRFGACLMLEPRRVADCVAAMSEAVAIPVTVKTRTGVDHHDTPEVLSRFVERVAAAGCGTFIIHARKAWLTGLSARENRRVPPLCHDRVIWLKREFPHLEIIVNGGVDTLEGASRFDGLTDGVMIGRAVYDDPYLLSRADRMFYGDGHAVPDRAAVVRGMLGYLRAELAAGTRLGAAARHLLNLFHGTPGARRWRRFLSEHMHRPGAGVEVLERALLQMEDRALGRVA